MAISCNAQSLVNASSCLCGIDQLSLLRIQTYLLCGIANLPGQSNTCLQCADSDPVDPPPCDCALAWNRLTAAFFYWTGSAWQEFLGP